MLVLGAAPLLFLHTELWGLPFLLAGALALRNEEWVVSAAALGLAALLRELYVLPLVLSVAVARRRTPALVAVAVVAVAGLVHVHFAQAILSPNGKEAAFGKSGLSPRYILSALGPSDRPLGWLVGVVGGAAGFWALRDTWASDPAARVLLPFAAAMVPLTVFFGREYWGLAFGPAVACFAPAVLCSMRAYLASTGARNLPV
jgi:hypothetical protein